MILKNESILIKRNNYSMTILSWNVNGINACLKKGFMTIFEKIDADIVCLQETKVSSQFKIQIDESYNQYWNYTLKKGYSGTSIISKKEPLRIIFGTNGYNDDEGRILTADYEDFYLVNCYSPHSKRDLSRLDYKHAFNVELNNYLKTLSKKKPVILCGDLNVAHQDIDLANYKSNRGNAGFTDIERNDFTSLLNIGFVDSFRYLYPRQTGAYTWWSYMKDVRARNIGWRIDYALISKDISNKLVDSYIYNDIYGSDHCPIELKIDM